jgi:hypothetical protein
MTLVLAAASSDFGFRIAESFINAKRSLVVSATFVPVQAASQWLDPKSYGLSVYISFVRHSARAVAILSDLLSAIAGCAQV